MSRAKRLRNQSNPLPDMLTIVVDLLNGRFYGRDTSDERLGEWPPHPARLFAALVSAAAETRSLERFRPILKWLEELDPPPDITAATAPWPRVSWNSRDRLNVGTPAPEAFLRINDPENKSGSKAHPIPALRTPQKRFFPSVALPGDASGTKIYYIWQNASPSPKERKEMEELCGRIGYLGTSRSKVRVFLTDDPPPRFGDMRRTDASFFASRGRGHSRSLMRASKRFGTILRRQSVLPPCRQRCRI